MRIIAVSVGGLAVAAALTVGAMPAAAQPKPCARISVAGKSWTVLPLGMPCEQAKTAVAAGAAKASGTKGRTVLQAGGKRYVCVWATARGLRFVQCHDTVTAMIAQGYTKA